MAGPIGRSPEADAIYQKYLTCCADIDTKIHGIDTLPPEQRAQQDATTARNALVLLKGQLFPEYSSQYNSAAGTLQSFVTRITPIEQQAHASYNKAKGIGAPEVLPAGIDAETYQKAMKLAASLPQPPEARLPVAVPAPQPAPVALPVVAAPNVQPVSPATFPGTKLEHSTWYVTWTSWDAPVPEGVDLVNIFVGKIGLDSQGKLIIDGFEGGLGNEKKMKDFIKACQNKGIKVKASIGGGGGRYDHCWDVLTKESVKACGEAAAVFCRNLGLDGIDFDPENFKSAEDRPAQQALVGEFIKHFKMADPNFHTSLCTNAGFGPYFPWKGIVENIFNGALITDPVSNEKVSGIDKLYIMAYFDPLANEQGWVTGWADWTKKEYGFAPSQITVGIHKRAPAYDPAAFAAWAGSKGYSTGCWEYDPNGERMQESNAHMKKILDAYKTGEQKA